MSVQSKQAPAPSPRTPSTVVTTAPSLPPTPTGSAAQGATPASPTLSSPAPTATGSEALVMTPPSPPTKRPFLELLRVTSPRSVQSPHRHSPASSQTQGSQHPLENKSMPTRSSSNRPPSPVSQGPSPMMGSGGNTPSPAGQRPTGSLKENCPTGPQTASENLTLNLRRLPSSSILGPRPAASVPVRRKKTVPPDFMPR
jgi:hypothetical protein